MFILFAATLVIGYNLIYRHLLPESSHLNFRMRGILRFEYKHLNTNCPVHNQIQYLISPTPNDTSPHIHTSYLIPRIAKPPSRFNSPPQNASPPVPVSLRHQLLSHATIPSVDPETPPKQSTFPRPDPQNKQTYGH